MDNKVKAIYFLLLSSNFREILDFLQPTHRFFIAAWFQIAKYCLNPDAPYHHRVLVAEKLMEELNGKNKSDG